MIRPDSRAKLSEEEKAQRKLEYEIDREFEICDDLFEAFRAFSYHVPIRTQARVIEPTDPIEPSEPSD